jgi:putative membrane protein
MDKSSIAVVAPLHYPGSTRPAALTAVSCTRLTGVMAGSHGGCEAALPDASVPPMDLAQLLPHVNATLNAAAGVLLLGARWHISRRRIDDHRRWMLAALGVSVLFLVSYIAYHYVAPIFVFRGHGWIRPVYYVLLISHVLVAAMSIPLILVTLWLAAHRADLRHRALARWTWPVWMYVSVSGVVVYLLLYQIYR